MRLIAVILIFAIFLAFIIFNLGPDYVSNVNVGFTILNDIPVYLTAFSSFVLGMVFSVPFVLSLGKRRKKSSQDEGPDSSSRGGETLEPRLLQDPADKKASKKKGRKSPPVDVIKKENSSYGID